MLKGIFKIATKDLAIICTVLWDNKKVSLQPSVWYNTLMEAHPLLCLFSQMY